METIIIVAAVLISLVIGILVGVVIRKKIAESKINGAEEEAKKLVELAKIEQIIWKKKKSLKLKKKLWMLEWTSKEIKEREAEIKNKKAELFKRRKI